MADEIDYGNLMHNAMRSLIQDVLAEVKTNGLPGEHHFFITFDTNHAIILVWPTEPYSENRKSILVFRGSNIFPGTMFQN